MSNSFFTEKFPLDKLKLYERNPRKISKKAIEAVAKSIRMNGALDPIEADEDGLILAGHTRYKAYKELGYNEVPVVQHTGMTAIQKRTYRIASNKTAEYSEWDDELLAAEMKDIDAEIDRVLAQDSTGMTEKEVLSAIDKETVDAEPQISKADELQKKWNVQRGDIWLIGNHRLMCGDSTSADDVATLMDGKKADMVFTDPPYGMRLNADYSSMHGMHRGVKHKNIIDDDKDYDASFLYKYFEYCKEQVWFGADYYSNTIPDTNHSGSWCVWDKRVEESQDAGFGSCFELMWLKQKHKRKFYRYQWSGFFTHGEKRDYSHPTSKSVKMIQAVISDYCIDKGIIADVYLGSGSTMLASENTGRICYGMEISPEYCSVVLERMKTAFPDIEIVKNA